MDDQESVTSDVSREERPRNTQSKEISKENKNNSNKSRFNIQRDKVRRINIIFY